MELSRLWSVCTFVWNVEFVRHYIVYSLLLMPSASYWYPELSSTTPHRYPELDSTAPCRYPELSFAALLSKYRAVFCCSPTDIYRTALPLLSYRYPELSSTAPLSISRAVFSCSPTDIQSTDIQSCLLLLPYWYPELCSTAPHWHLKLTCWRHYTRLHLKADIIFCKLILKLVLSMIISFPFFTEVCSYIIFMSKYEWCYYETLRFEGVEFTSDRAAAYVHERTGCLAGKNTIHVYKHWGSRPARLMKIHPWLAARRPIVMTSLPVLVVGSGLHNDHVASFPNPTLAVLWSIAAALAL